MAPHELGGKREMEALHQQVAKHGHWLLLERPGASTWRLMVRPSKEQIQAGAIFKRRYATLRDINGRDLAHAAKSVLRDLRDDPPAT